MLKTASLGFSSASLRPSSPVAFRPSYAGNQREAPRRQETKTGKLREVIVLSLVACCLVLMGCGAPREHTGKPSIVQSPTPSEELATLDLPPGAETYLGGQPQRMVVSGSHIFVADVRGLAIFDVGPTGSIQPLTSVATSGVAGDIVIAGHRAYVADGRAGLAVVDVSDLEKPRVLGHIHLRGGARLVRASANGELAVIGHDGFLAVLRPQGTGPSDASELQSMPVLALDLSGFPSGVAWVGQDLYVADRGNGLLRIQVAKERLRVVWTDRSRHRIRGLATRGTWLVTVASDKMLEVLDASGVHPRSVAKLELAKAPVAVDLVGEYAVVATHHQAHSLLVDLSDPKQPKALGELPCSGLSAAELRPGVVLVADASPALLSMALSPSPHLLTSLPGARVGSLIPIGEHSLIALGDDGSAGIDRHAPARLFRLSGECPRLINQSAAGDIILDLKRCGNALCALIFQKGICLLDPTRQGLPAMSCREVSGAPTAIDVQKEGEAVWVAMETGPLEGYRYAEGMSPIGSLEPAGRKRILTGLAICGSLAVGLDGMMGIVHLFDLSGDSPQPVGMFLTQAPPSDAALHEQRLLLAEPRFGVQVVDFGDPSRPREIGWLPMDPGPRAIAVEPANKEGSEVRVAMALGEEGVSLWRWDGGATLRQVARWNTTGLATDVVFAAGALWVADGAALVRIDVTTELP